MPLPTISALPSAPSRSDPPATFILKADAFVGALSTFKTELEAFGAAVQTTAIATNYNATSTSSTLIGTGSKSMTWTTGSLLVAGQNIRIASTASPANYMDGQVTSYNPTTGAAVIQVASVGGSGTFASWTISLAMAGSAVMTTGDQLMSGSLGIGASIGTGTSFRVSKNITGATSSDVVAQSGIVQSDVTTQVNGYINTAITAAAAFTLSAYKHFVAYQSTIGAGSAITNQYGFYVDSTVIGATNNFGFHSNIPAAANRWNFYAGGTAGNYFNGQTWFNNGIFDNATGLDIGGYKGSPINAQNGNYTLVLADQGKTIYSKNTGAQSVTIPTNASVAYPLGTIINIFNNGTTSISVVTTSLTVYQAGTANTGNRTLAAKGFCTIEKVETDTWVISGPGLS